MMQLTNQQWNILEELKNKSKQRTTNTNIANTPNNNGSYLMAANKALMTNSGVNGNGSQRSKNNSNSNNNNQQ
jgi:hypothetical protein